jgi:hypothetical protein
VSPNLSPDIDLVDEPLHSLGRREGQPLTDGPSVDAALIVELRVHAARLPLV